MAGQGNRTPARLVELRVLDGPNLYFTRPAVKLTLDVSGWDGLTEERAREAASRAGLPSTLAAGAPGTDRRTRFVSRFAGHIVRRLATAAGVRLAVRWRTGPEPHQIVVAYPWRRLGTAEALGRAAADLLAKAAHPRADVRAAIQNAARALARVEPGEAPTVPEPTIPTIAVTGTNGKTTVVRLLAHMGRTAGLVTAFSCTDGVYLNGEQVIDGDYSGFGGAGTVLSQPGVQLAILETARGGILLRGIGSAHNDVSVVTNISADHLGLHGIETLDQLAEVKSTIVRITRKDGWAVLNADDPRVIAMRGQSPGRPFAFALSPDNPWVRAALDEGGRAITVVDGSLSMLDGSRIHNLLPVEEVPMTIAGLSSINIANAMAGAAAGLGAGLPQESVLEALRTFVLDPERNPGRMNIWELDGRVVVVDYAHNEAGIAGMLEVCRGLCRPGREVWVAIASAGDRADDIVRGMGYLAARGADHVGVAELLRYLRGRDREELIGLLRAGALDGGADRLDVYPDELDALKNMLEASAKGDVVGISALAMRSDVFAFLDEAGATRVGPARAKALARRGRKAAAIPAGR